MSTRTPKKQPTKVKVPDLVKSEPEPKPVLEIKAVATTAEPKPVLEIKAVATTAEVKPTVAEVKTPIIKDDVKYALDMLTEVSRLLDSIIKHIITTSNLNCASIIEPDDLSYVMETLDGIFVNIYSSSHK